MGTLFTVNMIFIANEDIILYSKIIWKIVYNIPDRIYNVHDVFKELGTYNTITRAYIWFQYQYSEIVTSKVCCTIFCNISHTKVHFLISISDAEKIICETRDIVNVLGL